MHCLLICILAGIALYSCDYVHQNEAAPEKPSDTLLVVDPNQTTPAIVVVCDDIIVQQTVKIRNYFSWMDSVVSRYDSLVPYTLTEHILVHANSWLIDTLAHTDYYWQKAHGNFVYDQKQMNVLKPGDTLCVPSERDANKILEKLNRIIIDVNIPEYKLRIKEGSRVLYSCRVRVGKNAEQYLETANRVVNLRTVLGKGIIVEIYKDPIFINPCTGKRYYQTRRDDDSLTLMPIIPWLEPEIEGIRQGHLIHPTTNPETLGKAYSHGCIGTREEDAWRIYYHAPLGTDVQYRYDLTMVDEAGDTLYLEDIYHLRE